MIALLQRVVSAQVAVANETIAEIGAGVLALVCAERFDQPRDCDALVDKMLRFRMFDDPAGRMNRALGDVAGSLLLVPQFTLAADTRSGTRPSFTPAADPALGRTLFEQFRARSCRLIAAPGRVACGRFGAHMRVALVNDGPVTFWLRVAPSGAPHANDGRDSSADRGDGKGSERGDRSDAGH